MMMMSRNFVLSDYLVFYIQILLIKNFKSLIILYIFLMITIRNIKT